MQEQNERTATSALSICAAGDADVQATETLLSHEWASLNRIADHRKL
jgi:hypothetical protein